MDKDITVIVSILKMEALYKMIKDKLLELGYQNVIHISDFMQRIKCNPNNLVFLQIKISYEKIRIRFTKYIIVYLMNSQEKFIRLFMKLC